MTAQSVLPFAEIYRKFGEVVRGLRKRVGLSQASLARSVGLSRPSIANIEKGRQRVFLDQLFAIAAALDVDVRELLPSRKASLPPEVEKRLPRKLDEVERRALSRIVS